MLVCFKIILLKKLRFFFGCVVFGLVSVGYFPEFFFCYFGFLLSIDFILILVFFALVESL